MTGEGVTTTQRLPAPLAEPGAPIAPLDGSTLVLTPVGGDPRGTDLETSNSGMFDARLTKTGAMMGTPAYMAPEQFRGLATDARTDQFAFCIALYEALYDERPFAGNTLMALTGNVLNGRIREPPANTKVPLWIRKILLRGLRVNADERYPSMAELLDALGHNPAVARRRWLVASSALLLAGGFGFGVQKGLADSTPACGGGPEKLAGIWELVGRGRGRDAAPGAAARRVPEDGQELREGRLGDDQPRADQLRARVGRHVQGDVRGDGGAQGAVGGRAGPAHGVPERAARRPARVDGRVQRGDRRGRRERSRARRTRSRRWTAARTCRCCGRS